MDLSTVLLICAIAAGIFGGVAARFRRWGTTIADLATGLTAAGLFAVVSLVVLVLAADLDRFGIIHLAYLLIVVGFPVGVAIIVTPHLLNAEYRTPVVAWLLLVLAVGAVGAGIWATHIEPTRLVVDEQILGATGADQPLVIGVIADLQTGSIGSHERRALAEVLERSPDVVVIPGDLFQIEPDQLDARLPEFLGWLRELTAAVDHVIMVNGDVDDPAILEDFAEETGAIYLNDELINLDVNGQRVVFAGFAVDDETRAASEINPIVIDALTDQTTERDLVIAVSHYPDAVLQLDPDTTIDLIVSGHTHGGQLSLPRIGPPLTLSNVPRTVAAGGLHVLDGHPIYVSTGVGLERGQAPQMRFGVRPSVALITVVPA